MKRINILMKVTQFLLFSPDARFWWKKQKKNHKINKHEGESEGNALAWI